MKRTNISLTDEQYDWLKEQSYKHGQSISQLVRELIRDTRKITTLLHDYTNRKKLSKPPEKKPQLIDNVELEKYLITEDSFIDCRHDKPKNLCKQCIS